MAEVDAVTCWQCSFVNRAGDRFCGSCGVSLAKRDATTRYLCAAAHLDPDFADSAIAEFLVEPTRAIPPSPGVEVTAVLRDAVAARMRRRLRDAVLWALLLISLVVSPVGVLIWISASLLIAAASGIVIKNWIGRIVALALAILLPVVAFLLLAKILFTQQLQQYQDIQIPTGPEAGTGGDWTTPVAIVLFVLALAVVAFDEATVHFLVYTRFRPKFFNSDGAASDSQWERIARTLGLNGFRQPLRRVAVTEEPGFFEQDKADVIVHRRFSPFVGAGVALHRQVITLPLEPKKKDVKPADISVVEMQQHVGAAMERLRSTTSLGPGRRLDGLIRREQILMAADRLLANRTADPVVLSDLDEPPLAQLSVTDAHKVAEMPREWARYYQQFRIEAWDRDLTLSCFLHAGTDQRMLFLEWTFCSLLPIKPHYRAIDRYRNPFLLPLGRTVLNYLMMPAALVGRLPALVRPFSAIVQRKGEGVPDKYGADRSLRELAASDNVQSYFQDIDVERYVKILDSVLFRSVGQYLEDRGYSVVEFQRLADPVVNNFSQTVTGGTFVGSAVGFGDVKGQ